MGVGVQLGELALEVDAADKGGVVAVGAAVGWWASWRFVVADTATVERGAFVLPLLDADAGGERARPAAQASIT